MKQSIRTIGVMTSGGDAPGMNPAIRAVVRTALANDMKVLGIVGGYEGMIHGNFRSMGARDVGGILQRGGTILETRRSELFREPRGQREAIRQLNNAEIDAVVVIGGDGSLNGALKLSEQGICVVGVPASIDNDIWGTDMCIGVDTALNTIVDSIDKLRDTASSHNRAFLIEVMGRACGYLGVIAGVVTGAEVVLVPEVTVPVKEVASAIGEAYRRGKTHAIIIVAEGYHIKTNDLAKIIDDMDVGFTTRVTILGHIQRGGKPSAFDRNLATRFGVKAVEFLVQGENNVMTGLDGRDILPIAISEVCAHHRELNMDYYNMARMLAR